MMGNGMGQEPLSRKAAFFQEVAGGTRGTQYDKHAQSDGHALSIQHFNARQDEPLHPTLVFSKWAGVS